MSKLSQHRTVQFAHYLYSAQVLLLAIVYRWYGMGQGVMIFKHSDAFLFSTAI